MTRVLFIYPGLVPPPDDPRRDKLFHISGIACGEALLPVWWASRSGAPASFQTDFPVRRVGAFRYHFHLAYRRPKRLRGLGALLFYLRRGYELHRELPFDLIVSYGVNTTGVAGVLLKWLTGAKLAVEIPGVPEDAFRFDRAAPGFAARAKHALADCLLRFVGANSDCLKLLYPGQVSGYPGLRERRAAVFHDFVPVALVPERPSGERFVLAVGHPWYTKGMDLLIRAFCSVAPDFPDWRLKLMGYFPDGTGLERLAGDCPQVEFLAPRPNQDALEVIGACSLFVLASRTEAMGRVILEAMAARKPVLASRVGGVPHYVRDGVNGLLFERGNVEELAARLRGLMKCDGFRQGLADAGYRDAHAVFDEAAYVRAFGDMLGSLGGGARAGARLRRHDTGRPARPKSQLPRARRAAGVGA